jgi:hypothetical protein
MDGLDPLVASGIPCSFRVLEILHGSTWSRVEDAVPTSDERIRDGDGRATIEP